MGSSALMQRSSVLLPQPDGPIRHTTWCSSTSRSTPWSTWLSPNHLCTPWISRNGTSAGLGPQAFPPDHAVDVPRQWDRRNQEEDCRGGDRCEVEVVTVEQAGLVQYLDEPDEANE